MSVDLVVKYFPELSEEQKTKFAQLESLYLEWNEKINVISRKMLSDLAIWEPRSFEALVNISQERAAVEGLPDIKRRSAFNQVYGLSNLKLD